MIRFSRTKLWDSEYVKSALDDLVAGRRVQKTETQPQGCAIEY